MRHVQEHPGRDEPHRPAGVRIDASVAVGLVSSRVSAVELHDGIPALAELMLVRNVREQCVTATIARIVASPVAVLHGREQRRARIHLVRPGEAGEHIRRTRARLHVLIEPFAVPGQAVGEQQRGAMLRQGFLFLGRVALSLSFDLVPIEREPQPRLGYAVTAERIEGGVAAATDGTGERIRRNGQGSNDCGRSVSPTSHEISSIVRHVPGHLKARRRAQLALHLMSIVASAFPALGRPVEPKE